MLFYYEWPGESLFSDEHTDAEDICSGGAVFFSNNFDLRI